MKLQVKINKKNRDISVFTVVDTKNTQSRE